MGKNINIGMISDKINGITVNTSKACSSGNREDFTSRFLEYVVMHYTGNETDTAWGNANYFETPGREASAHLFVDDTEIYQSAELRDKAWHCGTTGTYYHSKCRNQNSIGIEMCCTAGNYKISEKTKENAAYACAYCCNLIGITADEVDTYVLRHYDVTHKECPAQMAGANNREWAAFKDMVRNILRTGSHEATGKPASSGKTLAFKVGDVVQFTGSTHYSNANAASGPACKAGKAKITATSKNGKHPYHLIAVSGSGSNVYGWVDADDVKEYSSSNTGAKLAVDGTWGTATTTRLQQIFGTPVDGVVSNQWAKFKASNPGLVSGWDWKAEANGKGSSLIKAMQKWAGMAASDQDGEIGPATIRALQKKLGTPVDGTVSAPSQMVKALQKWANNQ